MFVDIEWMKLKYEQFREQMFDGDLPDVSEMTFATNMRQNLWGYACHKYDVRHLEQDGYPRRYDYSIFMSNAYDSPEHIKETTFIHEMIHIYDYYNHPEHFIKRTWLGWKLRRDYDAHGNYFMSIAKKINDAFGYDIQKNVTDEEVSTSQMSDRLQKRVERKRERGYVIGYHRFDPQHRVYTKEGKLAEGMLFKCRNVNALKDIMSHYTTGTITAYLTTDSKFDHYAGCMHWMRGWYISVNEWDNIVAHLSDKTIVTLAEPKALAESIVYDILDSLFNRLTDGGDFKGEQIDADTIQIAIV